MLKNVKHLSVYDMDGKVKYGCKFELVDSNEELNRFIFKRTSEEDGKVVCYEAVVAKQSPKNGIREYPCSSAWGKYGFTISNNKYKDKIIDFFLHSEDISPEARHKFKMGL